MFDALYFLKWAIELALRRKAAKKKGLHIIGNHVAIASIFNTYSWCLRDFSTYTFVPFMNQ